MKNGKDYWAGYEAGYKNLVISCETKSAAFNRGLDEGIMAREAEESNQKVPIRVGDIAICHQGCVGLIIEATPIKVKIGDSPEEYIYKGIHLSADRLGKAWLSKKPKVIGNIYSLLSQSGVDFKKEKE